MPSATSFRILLPPTIHAVRHALGCDGCADQLADGFRQGREPADALAFLANSLLRRRRRSCAALSSVRRPYSNDGGHYPAGCLASPGFGEYLLPFWVLSDLAKHVHIPPASITPPIVYSLDLKDQLAAEP